MQGAEKRGIKVKGRGKDKGRMGEFQLCMTLQTPVLFYVCKREKISLKLHFFIKSRIFSPFYPISLEKSVTAETSNLIYLLFVNGYLGSLKN